MTKIATNAQTAVTVLTVRVRVSPARKSINWLSTELLLVKIVEDWRCALDKNLIVGIAFVDFRKAFNSIPHDVLLHKLQAFGIAGNLWSWVKDYLANRSLVTIVNGVKSYALLVRFSVPQLCFSLNSSLF